MVTTERPTPSADGTPPPTMARAGAEATSARPATIGTRLLIAAAITRTRPIAKGWSGPGPRVSRFRNLVRMDGAIDGRSGDLGFWRRAHHLAVRGLCAV